MTLQKLCPTRATLRPYLGCGVVCAVAALAIRLWTGSWRSGLACAVLLALFWVLVELKAGNEQPLEP
jgi:hypothetical protein